MAGQRRRRDLKEPPSRDDQEGVNARAVLPALFAAVTLAGCGSSGGSGTADRPVSADRPSSPLNVGITAGRIGPATTVDNVSPLREIEPGARIDPGSIERLGEKRRREGVGAGASCQNVDVAPVADNLGVIVEATLCLLNGERADRGLGPVTSNTKLAQAALAHSRDMVEKSYFAHDAPDGSDVADRVRSTGYLDGVEGWTLGENLAWGTGSLATPRSIVQAWMNSTGHMENILRREYREIGLGVVPGNPRSTDGEGATYTTAFGAVDGREPEAIAGTSQPVTTTVTTADGAAPSGSDATRVAGSTVKKVRRSCGRMARKARASRSPRMRVKHRRAAKRCRARAARLARRVQQ